MATQKQGKMKSVKTVSWKGGNDESGKFVSRDLCKVNPMKEQFEPTPAEPVRQHYKMAGGC